jgi:hypothetical protein
MCLIWRPRWSVLSSMAGLALCVGFAAPAAAASATTPIYTVPAPAAILVVLSGVAPPQWINTPDPALLPGSDLATMMPAAMQRLIADQEADLARFAATAEALAAGPSWTLETMLREAPRLGPGEANGFVMTSIMTGQGSCSETVTYSYPGNGAALKVTVRKTGNACPAGSPSIPGTEPSVTPTVRPQLPRVLEAEAPPDRLIPTAPIPPAELVSYPPAR